MGKLIVFEGLDGSGKSTQLERFTSYLDEKGGNYRRIKLPDYDSESSALVRMYLNGEFGTHPDDVNAYAASSFYAVDRYAGFKSDWGRDYENGVPIVADRYTTSNAIHQASKLPENKTDDYLHWLYDFEFNKLGLPKPDCVLFFDMPPEISQRLMSGRYKNDESKKDIHERDTEYLDRCRKAALHSAKVLGWTIIECAKFGEPLGIDEIAAKVRDILGGVFKSE
mgnify:FL=1